MDENNVTAALAAGEKIAHAASRLVTVDGIPVAIVPLGMTAQPLTSALDEAEKRGMAPRRRRGAATHQELDSFIAHVNRFKDPHSAVFANVETMQLTAVFDYHEAHERAGAPRNDSEVLNEGVPRWGQHRGVYSCPLSEQWKAWTSNDGKPMSQEDFANFIDARQDDIGNPLRTEEGPDLAAPARLIEMGRKLSIRTRGEFTREINEATGEFTLVNKLEQVESSTKIPRGFLVVIPVFTAGTSVTIEARIRMVLPQGGRPQFTFVLMRLADIKRTAFDAVRAQVLSQTGLPVFAGAPEQ